MALTLDDLRAAYAAGKLPASAMQETFRRLEALNDPGVFIHLRDEREVVAEAAALGPTPDPMRPLWGVPFAVKDNIDVAHMPTSAACPAFAYTPNVDASVVARLRAAGAVPIGKTNLDQFATGLTGLRTPHPPPRNAVNDALAPGGSSSGSAVIVAQGVVPFALGTDTAGSMRVPAGLNGVVGLKPSLGALSSGGVIPACRTLDAVGVFTSCVADALAVFNVAAAYDPEDPFSRETRRVADEPEATAVAPTLAAPDAATIRSRCEGPERSAFEAALERLQALGWTVRRFDYRPLAEIGNLVYGGPWVAERYTVVEELLTADREALHPITRQIISRADRLSAADAFRGLYRLAELKRAAEPILASADFLIVPTVPRFVTLSEAMADPFGPSLELSYFSAFANLIGLCGLSLPGLRRQDGLPGSLTLLGPEDADAPLMAAGRRIETALRPA